jgi:hypothetical protein
MVSDSEDSRGGKNNTRTLHNVMLYAHCLSYYVISTTGWWTNNELWRTWYETVVWPSRVVTTTFAWRGWGRPRTSQSVQLTIRLRFHLGVSRMYASRIAQSVTTLRYSAVVLTSVEIRHWLSVLVHIKALSLLADSAICQTTSLPHTQVLIHIKSGHWLKNVLTVTWLLTSCQERPVVATFSKTHTYIITSICV